MSACTFFGHRDLYGFDENKLLGAIKMLISRGCTEFYVGNQGNFDAMVLSALRCIKAECPQISLTVVLPYMPSMMAKESCYEKGETMLPDGIERVPKRFAIAYRNRYMIEKSDYVISAVKRSFGGASYFTEMARKKGREVINPCE